MKKSLSVRLNEKSFERLNSVSKRLGASKSHIAEKLLNNYLSDLYDSEVAKRILSDGHNKIIEHNIAKREILAD